MDSALIVSEKKHQEALAALLEGYQQIRFAANAGEARRMLAEGAFQLVLINTPLSDEFGRELARGCAERSEAGILLLVSASLADKVAAGVEKQGIFVVSKPVSKVSVALALRLIRTSLARIQALQNQNRQLLQKLDDMRITSRAKCALVGHFGMTEDEAHHFLEKRAMDLRITRRDAALDVLRVYGEEALPRKSP